MTAIIATNTRLPCCVPFCRRTTAGPFGEWICGKHWASVSRQTKRRRRCVMRLVERSRKRFHRQYAEQGWRWKPSQFERVEAAKRLADALWQRCKREAIERAAGI